ncbi:hypothetical protein HMPREF0765_1738 [Sphingobacterium spiritivorum ATCC 33300]|uniref:Uncharacterized protein n=1 Tax=Sphingobacterium spiritivorum ATCC 33300 TaxID=525372 RepID=C2FWN2_SPHSI|nr:hypothetical protein HMPREF0765_1738 [Sphingobacterium spiritivorum ATCC 33300]
MWYTAISNIGNGIINNQNQLEVKISPKEMIMKLTKAMVPMIRFLTGIIYDVIKFVIVIANRVLRFTLASGGVEL